MYYVEVIGLTMPCEPPRKTENPNYLYTLCTTTLFLFILFSLWSNRQRLSTIEYPVSCILCYTHCILPVCCVFVTPPSSPSTRHTHPAQHTHKLSARSRMYEPPACMDCSRITPAVSKKKRELMRCVDHKKSHKINMLSALMRMS